MADNTSYVAGVSTNGTTLSYGIETVAGQNPLNLRCFTELTQSTK